MRQFLKKAFDFIVICIWILIAGFLILFIWIPFSVLISGTMGIISGYLLSRGLTSLINSPLRLGFLLGAVAFFHILPLSYAAVRLKNIFVRNWRLRRQQNAEKNFSVITAVREIIPVIFGRLPSLLIFFLVGAVIVGLLPPYEEKTRGNLWRNLDFISSSVALIFIVCGVAHSLFKRKDAPFPKAGKWLELKSGNLWTKIKHFFCYHAPEAAAEIKKQADYDGAPVLALIGLLQGLIGGIAVSISFAFIFIYPIWVVGAAAFFSLFHFTDLVRMFREKMWFGFFGRIIILLAISSYLVGFICLSLFGFSNLFLLFLIFGVPVGLVCGWVWIWLDRYFPNNHYVRSFDQIVRGSYKLGVFWKEN